MYLGGSLYTIVQQSTEPEGKVFCLELDPEHFIYKAHFPGEPITPGVCILQMALELIGEAVGHPVQLLKAKNVKFLQVIRPEEHPGIVYRLKFVSAPEAQELQCQITVTAEEVTFAKLSLVCTAQKQ